MSLAQRAQVARIAPRSWAHVANSLPCLAPGLVATSFPGLDLLEANPCRDIKLVSRHRSGHSRSRPQNGVATPFLLPSLKPGRDIKFMSRPPALPPMLRPQSPTGQAATSISMSRPLFQPNQNKRCCDLKTMSRHQLPQRPPVTPKSQVVKPGRDATSWSRPHAQLNQVATSTRCRDLSRS